MIKQKHKYAGLAQLPHTDTVFQKLPVEVKDWAQSLPWNQRRYVLSLCYILCASTPDLQAEFLDDYTADGLVSKMFEDVDTLNRVKQYLIRFRVNKEIGRASCRERV